MRAGLFVFLPHHANIVKTVLLRNLAIGDALHVDQ